MSGKTQYTCPVHDCGKQFGKRWSLTRHQRTHTGYKPFRCKQCDKEFVEKCGLDRHEQTHQEDKQWTCVMSDCGRKFKLKEYLDIHKRTSHAKECIHNRGPKEEMEDRSKRDTLDTLHERLFRMGMRCGWLEARYQQDTAELRDCLSTGAALLQRLLAATSPPDSCSTTSRRNGCGTHDDDDAAHAPPEELCLPPDLREEVGEYLRRVMGVEARPLHGGDGQGRDARAYVGGVSEAPSSSGESPLWLSDVTSQIDGAQGRSQDLSLRDAEGDFLSATASRIAATFSTCCSSESEVDLSHSHSHSPVRIRKRKVGEVFDLPTCDDHDSARPGHSQECLHSGT